MYLINSQFRRLVDIASLILEGDHEGAAQATAYTLSIPRNAQREIDRLPDQDKVALRTLMATAKSELRELTRPKINKLQDDIWYFKIRAARAFYTVDNDNKCNPYTKCIQKARSETTTQRKRQSNTTERFTAFMNGDKYIEDSFRKDWHKKVVRDTFFETWADVSKDVGHEIPYPAYIIELENERLNGKKKEV